MKKVLIIAIATITLASCGSKKIETETMDMNLTANELTEKFQTKMNVLHRISDSTFNIMVSFSNNRKVYNEIKKEYELYETEMEMFEKIFNDYIEDINGIEVLMKNSNGVEYGCHDTVVTVMRGKLVEIEYGKLVKNSIESRNWINSLIGETLEFRKSQIRELNRKYSKQ